jgi:predicted dehydrogenase
MSTIKTEKYIALLGYGYWGKNLLRNMMANNSCYKVALAELSEERRRAATKMFPILRVFTSAAEAINDDSTEAVVIATDTKSHYSIARQALLKGKHVLVEKPLTTSLAEAIELNQIAQSGGLVLMVDHIFRYHPVVVKMKEYFSAGYLGSINYIDSTRINLGIYQKDVNVLWDLACHDLSIIQYLIDEKPISVRAIGRVNPEHGTEDITYLFLYYSTGLLVQINSSWASPVKMRKMIIGGDKRMLIYDDIEPTNKLVIYEYEQNAAHDVDKTRLTDYRLGNIIIPKFEPVEALQNVIEEFYRCVKTGKTPLTSATSAIEIINILEKAQHSLKADGAMQGL